MPGEMRPRAMAASSFSVGWFMFGSFSKQAHFSAEDPLKDQERDEGEQEPGAGFDERGFLQGDFAGVLAADALQELVGIRFTEIRAAAALGELLQKRLIKLQARAFGQK